MSAEKVTTIQDKFPIRVKPKPGEALSSYLARLFERNKTPFIQAYKDLNIRSRAAKRDVSSMDKMPDWLLDLKKLSGWTGLSVLVIRGMAFTPAYEKVFDVYEQTVWLNGIHEKKHRRFCPMCLKEQKYYKLLWQVRGIELCDIHKVRLTSRCPVCSTPQPYVSERTALFECVNGCGSLYQGNPSEEVNEEFISVQMEYYNQWNWLLSSQTYFNSVGSLTIHESIIVTLLYLTQGKASSFDPTSNLTFGYRDVMYLQKAIHDDEDRTGTFIRLNTLLVMIVKANKSFSDFQDVNVPASFIDSLISDTRVEVCLAPWCSSCGTSMHLRKVEPNRVTSKGVQYTGYTVCTECYMHYGYDSNHKEWVSVGGTVQLTQQARDILACGGNIQGIRRTLGVSQRSAYRILGYLTYRKLLPSSIIERYVGSIGVPTNILSAFKNLCVDRDPSDLRAYKLYGWNVIRFYYYLAIPVVQHYLVFELGKRKSRARNMQPPDKAERTARLERDVNKVIKDFVERDIQISIKQVAIALNTSRITLAGHDVIAKINQAKELQREPLLKKKVEQVLNEQTACEKFDVTAFLAHVGVNKRTLRNQDPKLFNWLNEVIDQEKQKARNNKIENYKRQIDVIVNGIREGGHTGIKIDRILREMGIVSLGSFRTNYPEAIEYIKSLTD